MPKVIVSGRGGSGKSTLVSLLARELEQEAQVLVLDSDESNLSLGLMLGLEPPPQTIMESLGGRPAVSEKMRVLFDSDFKEKPRFFEGEMSIDGLPQRSASRSGSLSFARVGKIEHSHEGCACPMGAVAKGFLNHISTGDGQWVLVDTEAGVEHFGRGLLEGADAVLFVADPSHEAVLLAAKAAELAGEAGKPFFLVLNKADAETEPLMREKLAAAGLDVLGSIPYLPEVARSNLAGDPAKGGLPDDLAGRIVDAVQSNLRV